MTKIKVGMIGTCTVLHFGPVNRVEVIDSTGRAYTKRNIRVEIQLQDDGHTMKLFVDEREGEQA